MEKNLICHKCRSPIEKERSEIGLDICLKCAKGIKRHKGINVFFHKTAATIQILTEEQYKDYRYYNPNFGRGSGLHKVSKSTGSV